MENLILSTYRGSQNGVTVRNMDLQQRNFFNSQVNPNGLAVDDDNHVYVVAGNTITKYTSEGRMVQEFHWSDNTIEYTCITYSEGRIIVGYTGSQEGFSVRDLDLRQHSFHNIGVKISGISAVTPDSVMITSGNHIMQYNLNGAEMNRFSWPNDSIQYTCVNVRDNFVYAGYNGSQQGYTVRDLNLNQVNFNNIGGNVTGITAGPGGEVYVTEGNHIKHYASNNRLIQDMTFPIPSIQYTGVIAYVGVMV